MSRVVDLFVAAVVVLFAVIIVCLPIGVALLTYQVNGSPWLALGTGGVCYGVMAYLMQGPKESL